MVVWTTTSLSVGEANALITAVSMVVCYSMSLMLASVSLEIRRFMIVRGKQDAIIQDEDFKSMWDVFKSSKTRRWTTLAVLPVLLGGAASMVIDFTTSGVSASIGHTEGAEVPVLGLVGSDVRHEYKVNPVGTGSEQGVYVFGNKYDTPETVDITFCVEVSEIEGDAFAISECREGLIVDKSVKSFYVKSVITGVIVDLQECSVLYVSIPLGNQGVGIVERDFTFEDTDGTEVAAAATCSSITESIIESCVWESGGILYFGDWNIEGAGECGEVEFPPFMSILAIDYGERVEQGNDTAALLAAMTAEIFAGTGLLTSRQQLVDVLGAIVRLESMAWDVQTAYDPLNVVEIGISAWVPVVLLLALVLPAMAWGFVKWHIRGKYFFLPVSPAEWSACAARELSELGKDGSRSSGTAKPLDEHYSKVYAFGSVVGTDEEGEGSQQRLGWINRNAVAQAATGKLSPFR
ncbi:expressed unknown protein [Ectocarpus siliculosus]|uniref:Uncharacterized protein n=1 Tax=Ectocarpus siliculosus TaxID=2880 RepID=D7G4D9_ECTSI|nr:expressed unknown protein [Ectocarpus siliculosus]|eukprot:CBJ33685.1 expressed unknown protein [Ectocarpus siliculosus]